GLRFVLSAGGKQSRQHTEQEKDSDQFFHDLPSLYISFAWSCFHSIIPARPTQDKNRKKTRLFFCLFWGAAAGFAPKKQKSVSGVGPETLFARQKEATGENGQFCENFSLRLSSFLCADVS
ncbi:MAG: hypothetical protein II192_00540, partial [Clostridia bacterium]|nr:hypothetical protein [Clostridia bacterium]